MQCRQNKDAEPGAGHASPSSSPPRPPSETSEDIDNDNESDDDAAEALALAPQPVAPAANASDDEEGDNAVEVLHLGEAAELYARAQYVDLCARVDDFKRRAERLMRLLDRKEVAAPVLAAVYELEAAVQSAVPLETGDAMIRPLVAKVCEPSTSPRESIE
jgi:hypothetical protein